MFHTMQLPLSFVVVLFCLCFFLTHTVDAGNVEISTQSGGTVQVDPTKLDDSTAYRHFVAHNQTQTCTADEHARPFNNQIRGINLGGWMVLEPWITPSLFYQFLDGDETSTAFDMYTFCQVLGPTVANQQLRRHWDTWVTEAIIHKLAATGAVNSMRLPVGDFMYVPYGPYVGCVDGALDYVEQLLDWAYAAGLSVLIDIHTMKGSQNGFDNSGKTMGFQWTSSINSEIAPFTTFQHWPIRTAEWIGRFNPVNTSYSEIYHHNIQHALDVIDAIVDTHSGHPAVLGLEPLNEPWQYTPLEELKKFYWDGYLTVKSKAPYWKYIIHDSFRFDPNVWGGFMDGCPDRAMDTHIYQAWSDPNSRISFYTDACSQKSRIAEMEIAFGPVIVGEWSLATDNCQMWLNGFNDNLPGFPRLPCKYIPCNDPYMGTEQPGTPVDPSKALMGPFGTGMSGPIFGQCPVTRDWLKESSGNPDTGRDWIHAPPNAPKRFDDTDNVMTHLANKKINAFSLVGHGFYFWNFRTDLYGPQWSYMAALERGWITRGNLNDDRIKNACRMEDAGEFKCVLKKGLTDKPVRNGVKYVLNAEGVENSTYIDDMSGSDLMREADKLVGEFWSDHYSEGATCDFGGIAQLVELNRTITDDDFAPDDDEYGYGTVYYGGPTILMMIMVILLVAVMGSCFGFVVAMRASKRFNRKVRESTFFRPISSSKSMLLRSSLALPALESQGYREVEPLRSRKTVA